MGVSIVEMLEHMGWFAYGIIAILLFMSIAVATIAIKKLIELGRARKDTLRFSAPFSEALANQDFDQAQQLVDTHKDSHLANTFRRVFPTLVHHAEDNSLSAVEVASVQRMIELNTLEQLAKFRRGLGVFATVGATAPFVGLLGTTMGVVRAFAAMGEDGGAGGIAAISVGISEAHITTAFGILVALPGVWFYNYFINRIDYISMEISYTTKEFMDFLLRYENKLRGGQAGRETNVGVLEQHGSPVADSARNRMS